MATPNSPATYDWQRLYKAHLRKQFSEGLSALAGCAFLAIVGGIGSSLLFSAGWEVLAGFVGFFVFLPGAFGLFWGSLGFLWALVTVPFKGPKPIVIAGRTLPMLPDDLSFVYFASNGVGAAVPLGALRLEEFAKNPVSRQVEVRCRNCEALIRGGGHCERCKNASRVVIYPRTIPWDPKLPDIILPQHFD